MNTKLSKTETKNFSMLPSTSDTLPVNWEPLPNYFRMLLNLSKLYLFLAFHNAHDIVAHLSNSNYGSQSTSIRNSAKNSITSLGHLWILPWQSARTFLAKGHSHRRWPTDSGFWQQISHHGSTITFLLCKFSLIRRYWSKHATQTYEPWVEHLVPKSFSRWPN